MKKIMICCSFKFYDRIKDFDDYLIKQGYEIIYPNAYMDENFYFGETLEEKSKIKKELYLASRKKIKSANEILVLNFDKKNDEKVFKNYIGPATFLEIEEAFVNNKKIFILNEMPDKDSAFYDDVSLMLPTLLHGDIKNIIQ